MLGAVDQLDEVVDLVIGDRACILASSLASRSAGNFERRLASVFRARWYRLNSSVLARVRLEYWISIWRVTTSAKFPGNSPGALQRST